MEERQRLGEAWSANVVGSSTDHVLVVLPSFSLSETLVAHYAKRLPALEHRYLVASLMLHRIPSCEMVFFACERPGQEVLDYYLDLAPEESRDSVRSRLSIVIVDDHSARGVAEKLLDRPDILLELRTRLQGRLALLEPWNVTSHEVELAGLLDIPVNGTSPELWPLGFKSAGRRIFRRAGVPVPLGFEDIRDLDDVRVAMARIGEEHPDAPGVVIKHDNSGAGDGNYVVRFGPGETEALDAIPPWFVHDLQFGGVVEELITGDDYSSPSVQVDITPYGEVKVLSTHEQVLGGEFGQVYSGCTFPANIAYAAELDRHSEAVGEVLHKEGALGRLGVDFVAVRNGSEWDVRAVEINLRRGGTTHPFCVLRHLVPGRYDGPGGRWLAEDGTTRAYRSTDNLVDPAWLGLSPAAVIGAVREAGLAWNRATRTGVALHMLSGLGIDGRIGLTAIGRDAEEADRLYAATSEAIHALTP